MLRVDYIYILLFLILTSTSLRLNAQNIMASDVTYKCLGNDKYEVTLTAYRQCVGGPVLLPVIQAQCDSGFVRISTNLISTADITNLKANCPQKSSCNGGAYDYSIEKVVFREIIDISTLNCCDITLFGLWGKRNSNITTGGSNVDFSTSLKLNKCISSCNSSPSFKSLPILIATVGEDFEFKNQAVDSQNVEDSLSFKLINPITGFSSSSFTPYIGAWSPKLPITFLGFPFAELALPAGFHFDSTTGDMKFRPTISNQVSITTLEVTEWRKINGVMTEIAKMKRELQIIVTPANKPLRAHFGDHPRKLAVCSLTGTLCRDIPLQRIFGYSDTIDLQYTSNLQNITFNNIGSPSNPKVRVCYTPTVVEVNSGKSLNFSIKATTISCPFNSIDSANFEWVVRPHLPDSFAIEKKLECNNLEINLLNSTTTVNRVSAFFEVKSSTDTLLKNENSFTLDELKDSGWLAINMTVEDNGYCGSQTYYDSIYIPLSSFFALNVPKDTLLCNINTIALAANTINGVAPYTYKWTGDDTSTKQTLNTTINKTYSQYFIEVMDKNNCVVADSVTVRYFDPQVSISGDSVACARDEIEVNATFSNTTNPIYQWIGFGQGQAKFKAQVSRNSLLAFALLDSSGCALFKTHFVRVYAPTVNYTHDNVFCGDDTILLSLDKRGGLPPYSVKWLPYNTFGDSLNLGVQNRSKIDFSTVITDAFGCIDSQAQSIRINRVPKVTYTPITPVCEGDSAVLLSNYVVPSNGVWSGAAVSDNVFKPYSSGVGKKSLSFLYVDSFTFCSKTISAEIEVQTQPVASFIVDSTKASYTHDFVFTNASKFGSEHSFLWDFGDALSGLDNTDTAKNTTHTFSDTGSYSIKLVVSGGACLPDSVIKTNYIQVVDYTIDTSTISVKEIRGFNNLKVYPNPTAGNLIVESNKEISGIEIHDMLGRVIFSKEFQSTLGIAIDVALIPAGSYTLSIIYSNSSDRKTIQFLKE